MKHLILFQPEDKFVKDVVGIMEQIVTDENKACNLRRNMSQDSVIYRQPLLDKNF